MLRLRMGVGILNSHSMGMGLQENVITTVYGKRGTHSNSLDEDSTGAR